jgi:hypothetical protein
LKHGTVLTQICSSPAGAVSSNVLSNLVVWVVCGILFVAEIRCVCVSLHLSYITILVSSG